MLNKLSSKLIIILCIALVVGVLLLLGIITGTHSSQTGIMIIAPAYHLAFI